jgi:uncharacterized protein (DUF488 family)
MAGADLHHAVRLRRVTRGHLFTIGYQGVDIGQLLASLEAAGVSVVIDTRENPTSRRVDFRSRRLADALSARGIAYVGIPELGAPKDLRAQVGHWPTFEAGYRSRIADQRAVITIMAHVFRDQRVCLLCFEDDPAACHRSILVDELERQLTPVATVHLRPRWVDETDNSERVRSLLHGADHELQVLPE